MARKPHRVTPDLNQPVLSTDDDTFEGETPYEIGHRHGLEGHEFYDDRLPAEVRQAYARGYTRGTSERTRDERRALQDR